MLSQTFSVIIELGISVPVHGIEVIDGLNYIDKSFIFQLISIVQLPFEKVYDTQVVIHTATRTSDVSLAREFQKYMSHAARKHGVMYQGKYKKWKLNGSGQKGVIMFRRILMLRTKTLKYVVI